MTVAEQRFMEVVPDTLRRIAAALEGINEKLELLAQRREEEPSEEPVVPHTANPADYENDRILDTVFREMGRLEGIEKEEKQKKNPGRRVQVSGNAVRFLNAAHFNEIDTVGQLLKVGRQNFEKMRYAGKVCAEAASVALKNLYGIETW